MGKLSGYLHSGYGYDFAPNTTNIVDKRSTNIFKFLGPEQAVSSDMIKIQTSDDKVYATDEPKVTAQKDAAGTNANALAKVIIDVSWLKFLKNRLINWEGEVLFSSL